jgi:hypothetical protein
MTYLGLADFSISLSKNVKSVNSNDEDHRKKNILLRFKKTQRTFETSADIEKPGARPSDFPIRKKRTRRTFQAPRVDRHFNNFVSS